MANAESSKETSEDLKKQILEQTSMFEEAEETAPETEGAVVVEEATTEEVPEGEETTEVETPVEKPKKKAELHKIVVEGKEEEVPYDKLKEYAQKGRYLEREMAKLKAERERIRTNPQTGTSMPQGDMTQVNQKFVEDLQRDTFGTMVQFYQTARQFEKQQEAQERMADKEFELDKKELPHYMAVKSTYNEFRDLGYNRETAWAMAEADYFKGAFLNAMESGRTEGEKKAKLQSKAKIAVAEKKTKEPEGRIPSEKELEKMPSTEIAKFLKRTKVPGW